MIQTGQKLRVLHVVLSIGETNATYNEHCLPLMEEREIGICTYFAPGIQPPSAIRYSPGDGSLAGFFRALRQATQQHQYDVIHTHSPHVGLLVLLATWFFLRSLTAPLVMTIHDSYPNFKLRNRLLLLPVFAFFDRIVCCSHVSFASFPISYKLLAGKRLCAIQNGIDIARVDRVVAQQPPQQRDHSTFHSVAICRLVAIKNPLTVVDAFAQSADATSHLTVIGDGVLRDQIRERSNSLGVADRVQLTGLIPRNQVYEHLLRSDLFISASRGEGLPIAVLEAMAVGCPVLLSNIPPHREIAAGVDCITLVDPDNTTGFADAIRHFRSMSVAERMALGQRCRQVVEQRFSLASMHAGYASVYAQVMRPHNTALAGEAR